VGAVLHANAPTRAFEDVRWVQPVHARLSPTVMLQPFPNFVDLPLVPENESGPESKSAAERSLRPLPHSLVVPAGTRHVEPAGSASEAFVAALVEMGVEHAFGVFGGGIAPFCSAISESPIRLMHCRSETGAAFA